MTWGRHQSKSCFYINWIKASSYKCVSSSSSSIYFFCYTVFFLLLFIPGVSDPQVGPRHQPGKRSDGWHEGSGGGGGQGRQHRPGTPQGPGEYWNACIPLVLCMRTNECFLSTCHNSCVISHNELCQNWITEWNHQGYLILALRFKILIESVTNLGSRVWKTWIDGM